MAARPSARSQCELGCTRGFGDHALTGVSCYFVECASTRARSCGAERTGLNHLNARRKASAITISKQQLYSGMMGKKYRSSRDGQDEASRTTNRLKRVTTTKSRRLKTTTKSCHELRFLKAPTARKTAPPRASQVKTRTNRPYKCHMRVCMLRWSGTSSSEIESTWYNTPATGRLRPLSGIWYSS